MKATLFDSSGKKKSEINLPKIFGNKVRPDLVQKYFEADKLIQPYSPYERAGQEYSASGKIRHRRHRWKSHYGRGIARVPRKTMWRRGTQFYWVGATAPGTRGGRRAHPPKGIGKEKKINKKEIQLAFSSAFSATAIPKFVESRYSSLDKAPHVPAVIDVLPKKTKDMISTVKKIFSDASDLAFKKKTVRPGRGSSRGRKYKSNAGLLVLTGEKEKAKISGLDIKSINDVAIADLYPLGRLVLYTQKAIDELQKQEEKK